MVKGLPVLEHIEGKNLPGSVIVSFRSLEIKVGGIEVTFVVIRYAVAGDARIIRQKTSSGHTTYPPQTGIDRLDIGVVGADAEFHLGIQGLQDHFEILAVVTGRRSVRLVPGHVARILHIDSSHHQEKVVAKGKVLRQSNFNLIEILPGVNCPFQIFLRLRFTVQTHHRVPDIGQQHQPAVTSGFCRNLHHAPGLL